MIKPPIYINIVLLKYSVATSVAFIKPNNGIRTNGNSEVTDNGMASVIHHIAVIAAIYLILTGDSENPNSMITKNTTIPNIIPKLGKSNFSFILFH